MLKCLLFGHEPHPTFAKRYWSVAGGLENWRETHCERCYEWVVAPLDALPSDALASVSTEERDAVLAETIVATLLPALDERMLIRRRRIPRKTAEPTENGEG